MPDDIVTRLREKYQGQLPICAEAADEIERLRKDMGHLSAVLIALGEALQEQADGSDA